MAPLNFPKLACWLRSRCRSQTRASASSWFRPITPTTWSSQKRISAERSRLSLQRDIKSIVLLEDRGRLGGRLLFKLLREQNAEIAKIVARRSRDDAILKPGKKTKGIAAPEIIAGSKPGGARPLKRLAVGHVAGGGARTIHAVGSRPPHPDLPPPDFSDPVQPQPPLPPPPPIPRPPQP